MKILLFDMDGVLLEPHGYHLALQETVHLMARSLGYPDVHLTSQEITAFETAGISSEWDTAAICTALLLEHAWRIAPKLSLPEYVTDHYGINSSLEAPDFGMLAYLLGQPEYQHLRPLQRAESFFCNHSRPLTQSQSANVQAILQNARAHHHSLTHRIFQELVLGSQMYSSSYNSPPQLHSTSYLLTFDQSNLSSLQVEFLLDWLKVPSHRAAIFTGRPSRPLPGAFSTPEAELGAQLVGLKSLPILGLGGLLWLADRLGQNHQTFLKPSPVHVLAALQICLGISLESALLHASQLYIEEVVHASWYQLSSAEVYVFEDTVAGLHSAQEAQRTLNNLGITFELHQYGIASRHSKSQVLTSAGAQTFIALDKALSSALQFS